MKHLSKSVMTSFRCCLTEICAWFSPFSILYAAVITSEINGGEKCVLQVMMRMYGSEKRQVKKNITVHTHTYQCSVVHGQRTDGGEVALVQEVTLFCIIIICSVICSLLL